MCKQITLRWLFCNNVKTVQFITVEQLVKKWQVQKKSTHKSDRDIGGNEAKENTLHVLMWWPWFHNLLWVYRMDWMSVRFPSLKLCPSLTLGPLTSSPSRELQRCVLVDTLGNAVCVTGTWSMCKTTPILLVHVARDVIGGYPKV